MDTFEKFGLSKQLNFAIEDLGFKQPTPIQSETFNIILSGKDIVGIAQTGTGKTVAFMLPILEELKFLNLEKMKILEPGELKFNH